MRPAYTRIAWGLALELIDFRIQNFDVLPDALGYLLILIGLAGVRPRNGRFVAAWMAAFALLIESLSRLAGGPPVFNLLQPQTPDPSQWLMVGGIALAELIMLYGICIGIRVQALSEKGQAGLALSALRTWQAAFGLGAAILFMLPFSQTTEWSKLTPLLVMLSLGSFIAALWVIVLVVKAGKRGAGGGGGDDEREEGDPSNDGHADGTDESGDGSSDRSASHDKAGGKGV